MGDLDNYGLKVFERQLLIVIIAVFAIFALGYFFGSKSSNTSRPIEEIVQVDSFIKLNDSIKLKVNQLDSIKDAKIIEVQSLDNDSTIKLFYELIRK